MAVGYYVEQLTPTKASPIEDVIACKYGIHFLVDYVKGTGTETSISFKVQYKFDDNVWRDRVYLDGQNIAQTCIETYKASEFHTFISAPTMQPATKIRIVATFNGYTSGAYGLLTVAYRRDTEQRP